MIATETLAALLLLGLVALTVTNYHYQRRQALALEGVRRVHEDRRMDELAADRSDKAGQDLIGGDAVNWLARQWRAGGGPDGFALNGSYRSFGDRQTVRLETAGHLQLVVSAHSPGAFRRMARANGARQRGAQTALAAERFAPLGRRPRFWGPGAIPVVERSLLNAGRYFDLAAAQAGQKLAAGWETPQRLFFYLVKRG